MKPVWIKEPYGYRVVLSPKYSIELYRTEDGWLSAFIDEPVIYNTDLPLPFGDAFERVLAFAEEWGVDVEEVRRTRPGKEV